jgi:hypothetical protein
MKGGKHEQGGMGVVIHSLQAIDISIHILNQEVQHVAGGRLIYNVVETCTCRSK